MLSTNELLMPCAKTATKTTTPRPIISAEAVAAVRPGFLTLLSRARRPLTGAIFCTGQRPDEVLAHHRDGDEHEYRAYGDSAQPRRRVAGAVHAGHDPERAEYCH